MDGADAGSTAEPDGAVVMDDAGMRMRASCDGTEDGFCPCGTATMGSKRYLFCRQPVSWEDARARCEEFGYELVRIESQDEHDFVWTSASEYAGIAKDWWVGLSDQGTEGEYVWADGAPLGSFTAWGPMQPDQGGSEAPDGYQEDCVELHADFDGLWNDLDCAIDYGGFICQGGI